jgi:hypothetical protein
MNIRNELDVKTAQLNKAQKLTHVRQLAPILKYMLSAKVKLTTEK